MNAKNIRHTRRIAGPASPRKPGRPCENAVIVTPTPSCPMFQLPVMIMVSPVIVHTMSVSINVPVMDTSPCLTGSRVDATAAAMGAEPSPASLENMPRAIPICIATSMLPAAPPATALGLKAPTNICLNASGRAVTLVNITISPNRI